MRNLMRANLSRLWRSLPMWCSFAGAFLLSTGLVLNLDAELMGTVDEAIMQAFPFLVLYHAAFVSLFLGIEYQDGTMRNKLIAGHPRWKVYVSYLLTAVIGCEMIMLGWALSIVAGVICFGWFAAPAQELLLAAVVILLLTAAVASILSLIGVLASNRAVSAVVSILVVLALLVLGSSLYNALCEPELVSNAVITDNGVEFSDPETNPFYVAGTKRVLFQFAIDALPSGQAILLANQELEHPMQSICASIAIFLLVSLAGNIVFRRKDLK